MKKSILLDIVSSLIVVVLVVLGFKLYDNKVNAEENTKTYALSTYNIDIPNFSYVNSVIANNKVYILYNNDDYYLLKEITEAALVDAVDYSYYRTFGEIKINKEKFYESFLRRFSENASTTTTYTVSFYGVYEAPPKVSVEIKSKSNTFNVMGDSESFDMVDRINAIIEGNTLS